MVSPLPLSERNLILTGYTGPNQPLIGQQAAQRLHMPYVNIEMQIEERTGLTVDDIRVRYGETRLKTIESEIIHEAALRRNAVIRVSGRALMYGDHLAILQETGPVICLVATLDSVLQRLHLVMGARYHNPHERAEAVGRLRSEWAVRSLPGIYELDITYLSPAETVDIVIDLWQALAIRRG